MLSKSRCPHTGVVNYFTQADPLLAVGSVAEAREAAGFAWRCYVGEEAGGLAPDLPLAEARLKTAIARGQRRARPDGPSDPVEAAPSTAAKYWQRCNEAGRKPVA